jgi:DNA-binding beta-propeller fold protein YncE
VNDHEMEIWSAYGVRAWPTLILINPLGKIIGSTSGEGIFNIFDKLISDAIGYFKQRGDFSENILDFEKEKNPIPTPLLSFPGKILADESARMLFIADSNNNRILGIDLNTYHVKFIAGSGIIGFRDGKLDISQFNHPQGMAFDSKKRILYVADTENHSIRKVDLNSGSVSTIAGTGIQRELSDPLDNPLKTSLNSPWDLVLLGDSLFIAMAGSHQIWRLDLEKDKIGPFAGSGREALIDGPPMRAALAQPSGITSDGEKLYFADSETSSIRSCDLRFGGEVKTIVGQDLFVFGDRDGKNMEVRLQHPLGLTFYKKNLYIADTYNSKIKIINPIERTATTICGNGEHGFQDGEKMQAQFNEPGGITVAFEKLYIADTNNHAVRVFELSTGALKTIAFPDPVSLVINKPQKIHTKMEQEHVIQAGASSLTINIVLPQGYKINENAPSFIKLDSDDNKILSLEDARSGKIVKNPPLKFNIKINSSIGKAVLSIEAMIFYCSEENSAGCFILSKRCIFPVVVKKRNPNAYQEFIINA